MKAEVIVRFRDKDSDKVFEATDIFVGSEKRVKQLQKAGYLSTETEKVEEKEETKKPKKKGKVEKEGE